MAEEHTVMQGDCFSSIAKEYGFLEQTLWNHPANAALKQKRRNPNVLLPGDMVIIPDRESGTEQASTEQKHIYKTKGEKTELQLQLLIEDEPLANAKYCLTVGSITIESSTDGDGWVREKISAAAKSARLLVSPGTEDEEEYELLLGHLDPAEEDSGVVGRLNNLGFFFDLDNTEDEGMKLALQGFQKKHGLQETGKPDAATVERLKAEHGS